MNVEKLQKMAGAVRTGGKGSMRRKKKVVHKSTTADDKRLQNTLKRIGVNDIPAIDDVNIFKDDTVIQFQNPKVQVSVAANTWVISGSAQTNKLQDLLPSLLNQLAPDNMESMKKLAELAEQLEKHPHGATSGAGGVIIEEDEDDDDVPQLDGETFEAASENQTT